MDRRRFLQGLLGGAAAVVLPGAAAGQTTPPPAPELAPLTMTVRWEAGRLVVQYVNPNEVPVDTQILLGGVATESGLHVLRQPPIQIWGWSIGGDEPSVPIEACAIEHGQRVDWGTFSP